MLVTLIVLHNWMCCGGEFFKLGLGWCENRKVQMLEAVKQTLDISVGLCTNTRASVSVQIQLHLAKYAHVVISHRPPRLGDPCETALLHGPAFY